MKKKRDGNHSRAKPKVSTDVMARDFLGLALEEFRVAEMEDSVGTQEHNVYARNKALQSAGMGMELVYKALILGQRKTPIGFGLKGHRIGVLHGQLSGTDKEQLEERIRDVGWPAPYDWCRYMDDTVNHAQRKYLMYDPQRQRQGVSFPTHGPASVAGIKCVFDKALELADCLVDFREHQRRLSQSQAQSPTDGLPAGVARGPLIAEINLAEGFAPAGEPLGGIELNPRTGAIRIVDAGELKTDTDR